MKESLHTVTKFNPWRLVISLVSACCLFSTTCFAQDCQPEDTLASIPESAMEELGVRFFSLLPFGAFGYSFDFVGDIDGNGSDDLVVAAPGPLTSGVNSALLVLFMDGPSTVLSARRLDGETGAGLTAGLSATGTGFSVRRYVDLNSDGIDEILVGIRENSTDLGEFRILSLDNTGTPTTISVIDEGDLPNGELVSNSLNTRPRFGESVASIGDVDGDGVGDIAVGSPYNAHASSGGASSGAVHILFMNSNGTVKSSTLLESGQNGIPAIAEPGGTPYTALFGYSIEPLGDINNDDVPDIAVGTPGQLGSGIFGGVFVVTLNPDGSALAATQISNGSGGVGTVFPPGFDLLGHSVANAGDLDGDGVPEIVIGLPGVRALDWEQNNQNGKKFREGRIFTAFLNSSGTVKSLGEISSEDCGVEATANWDSFGVEVRLGSDIDGDGVPDLLTSLYSLASPGSAELRYVSTANSFPDGSDLCPENPNKETPDICGCADTTTADSDDDGVLDCIDICPGFDDAIDQDNDGAPDLCDSCPTDPSRTGPISVFRPCPCNVTNETDSDDDGVGECRDACPGFDDAIDTDDDGLPDGCDECPSDPDKTVAGSCGCGEAEQPDSDGDGVSDCIDLCPFFDDALDRDNDGTPDLCDECPDDTTKSSAGSCGCGTPETTDSDSDTIPDCLDVCPGSDDRLDGDGDGTPDACDGCPSDGDKSAPGTCGCGAIDATDSDLDGTPDCIDRCPGADDSEDNDRDNTPNACDGCPFDVTKTEPGVCGCGVSNTGDSDNDTVDDCIDACQGFDDRADRDGDGVADGCDRCPDDGSKVQPGVCGCGVASIGDSDGDGIDDCIDRCAGSDDRFDSDFDSIPDGCDQCPEDPSKARPGECGCGVRNLGDSDGDGADDCIDTCPGGNDSSDQDGDGTPDDCDECPNDPAKVTAGACGCGTVDGVDLNGDGSADCAGEDPISTIVDQIDTDPTSLTKKEAVGAVKDIIKELKTGGERLGFDSRSKKGKRTLKKLKRFRKSLKKAANAKRRGKLLKRLAALVRKVTSN